jgi:hypothetical protein
MLDLIDSDRIRREIAKKYESDPRGWRLLWGIDNRGHYNFLVTKDSKFWWLKEELINPLLSVGCGVRSHLENDLEDKVFAGNRSIPSFGFRPVPEDRLKRIIADLAMGRDLQVPIREILRSEPRRLRELDTSFLMHGPLHYVNQFTDVLSDKQRQLDDKLNSELERLVLKRYPQLRMSYT